VKVKDSEVQCEPEDDGMKGREGEVWGKRRKVGGGMQGKGEKQGIAGMQRIEMLVNDFAPIVEEKEDGGIDIPFGDPRCLR
jgi:hypothetical protein